MNKAFAAMLVAVAGGGWLPAAHAQVAYAAKDVNLRAGPARDYPVVAVIPSGASLAVQGCLSDYAWCDTIAGPYRGWVYAGNIAYAYEGQYVPLASYGPALGIAIVGFVLFDYWDRFYPAQPFFRDRDRWERHPPYAPQRPPPRREPPAWPSQGQLPVRDQPPVRAQPPVRVQPPVRGQLPVRDQAPVRDQPPMRVHPPSHVQPRDHGVSRPLAPPARDPGGRGQGRPGQSDLGNANR